MDKLRTYAESRLFRLLFAPLWRRFGWVAILWILPKAPTACDTCGAPVREHGPKKPLDEMHFLDREHFYGSRIRAESDGILTTLYLIRCDGKISDSFLLLDSDCEAIRDALDEHLHRKGIR